MRGTERALMISVVLGGVFLVLAPLLYLQHGSQEEVLPRESPVPGSTSADEPDEKTPVDKDASLPGEAVRERVRPESHGKERGSAASSVTVIGAITGRVLSEFGGPVPEAEIRTGDENGRPGVGPFFSTVHGSGLTTGSRRFFMERARMHCMRGS